ncbi:MAG TPA: hypothetical protein VI565_08470, partial [Burkholderiales bacterium]|nr:hypothetical protein [Burkholderiales bacterium]
MERANPVYEFYSPFAHVPGKWEWCRIRSPTHGTFDSFIALGAGVGDAATVYVSSDEGKAFMDDRYPECATYRVPPKALRIEETQGGRSVSGRLRADDGPVREIEMTLAASKSQTPRVVPYG